jgi:serine/threonine-protein kinase
MTTPDLPSHYRVLEKIGEGGMGEVHRAVDTKLGRDVALKTLPAAFARDAERLARLRREARMLAALNHPNIAAVFDLVESGETCVLVLEFVPGLTLADRVARGPLPWRDALAIGVQMADALEAAHDKNIVHRDLKPANVKVTPDDRVKLLDFGLAKAAVTEPVAPDDATGPLDLSERGVVLGTPAYMSPEQARGLPVGPRTDIWSFGCVMYELLSGRKLFVKPTSSDIIAAILSGDPSVDDLPNAVPAPVRELLRRCLRHDQRRRLRHIGDARIAMDEALAGGDEAAPAVTTPAVDRAVQFQRLSDTLGLNESPAISPDGKMVAFVAPAAGRRQIWLRLMAGGAPLQITRDDADHEQPRWAPDSSVLIFYTPSATPGEHGTLWEISALGGSPRPIGPALGGGDISHDGRRIAVVRFEGGAPQLVIATRDGTPITTVRAVPTAMTCQFPRWSPDDRLIAINISVSVYFDQRLVVVPVEGDDAVEVVRGGMLRGVAWLPDGTGLVYSSSAGSTMLYPPTFNLRRVGVDGGDARAVTYGDASFVELDVHASGKLVVCRVRSRSDIWKFPVHGSAAENTRDRVRVTHQTGQVQVPTVSPDGGQIAYVSDNGGHSNLWVARTDGSAPRQLTFERDPGVSIGAPSWSPAGALIVVVVARLGRSSLWLIRPDGSGLRQIAEQGLAPVWAPDGESLYYTHTDDKQWGVEKIAVAGGPPALVREDYAVAVGAGPSTLYYASRLKNDTWDVEIRRASPEGGPPSTIVRLPGARMPLTPVMVSAAVSPDGRTIAIALTDGATTNLWAQPIEGGPLRPLTDFGERPTLIVRGVSWSPDGQFIYAAVAESDADVVLLDGLL